MVKGGKSLKNVGVVQEKGIGRNMEREGKGRKGEVGVKGERNTMPEQNC